MIRPRDIAIDFLCKNVIPKFECRISIRRLRRVEAKYSIGLEYQNTQIEPPRDKTNKMACAPSEDSDQPGHPPSLIRVFAVRMKKVGVLSYPLSAQAA